jgi:gamma-glutamyltranspeptidase/glutathione hydrolase
VGPGEHADFPLVLSLEGRIPKDVQSQLRRLGHKIEVLKDWGSLCSPTMVEYDSATGVIRGGADVRSHRYALGW